MLDELDQMARKVNISRQAVIKMMLAVPLMNIILQREQRHSAIAVEQDTWLVRGDHGNMVLTSLVRVRSTTLSRVDGSMVVRSLQSEWCFRQRTLPTP